MPQAPAVQKTECWFEFYRTSIKDALKAGIRRPERIFSSEDERWAVIAELSKKNPLQGNLLVGTVKRIGEDFVDGTINLTVPGGCHITSIRWDKAREKMRLFETDGRFGSTLYADTVREAENAKKRGEEQSERTMKALETLASTLSKSGAGK